MIEKRVFIQCDACGACELLNDLDLETSEKWHETHLLTPDKEKENIHHFCASCFEKAKRIWEHILKSLAKHVGEYK